MASELTNARKKVFFKIAMADRIFVKSSTDLGMFLILESGFYGEHTTHVELDYRNGYLDITIVHMHLSFADGFATYTYDLCKDDFETLHFHISSKIDYLHAMDRRVAFRLNEEMME